jgi:hypothetical protein
MLDIGEHTVVKGNLCIIEEDFGQKVGNSFKKQKGSSHGQGSPIRKKTSMNVCGFVKEKNIH